MTGDLLQADVDLARRLLQSGQPEDRVIDALCLRRVNPGKARAAVRDLKAGWDVRGEDLDHLEAFALPVQAEQRPAPQPERPAVERLPVQRPALEQAPVERTPVERRPIERGTVEARVNDAVIQQPAQSSSRNASAWLSVGGVALCAAIAGIWLLARQQTKIHAITREVTKVPELKLSVPAASLRRHSASMQITGGKVSLDDVELRGHTALAKLNEVLGPPSRTNRIEGFVLYTYDEDGIILYSSQDGAKDSLVVYLETMGGSNGVQKPFSGALMVQGHLVIAATDQKSLSGIKDLALKQTVTNVFAGDCGGLGINFAYLKEADRLTMVQVDLY